MPQVGLKYPIYAPLTETATEATYAGGAVIGEAIKADISIELTEGKLYANDVVSEADKEFKQGKIILNVNDLADSVKVDLFGHTQEPAGITDDPTAKMLVSNGSDNGKYVGVGFYGKKKLKGAVKWRAIWFTKVLFGEPNESLETKGESITYQTPTTEGLVMLDVTGNWKKEVTVDTEAKAKAWLNGLAGIV
ncbi:MAG TPA: major tail protein [Negativicutes bacterium]|nr:major tail protein [Negativicutes bacterium]